MIDAIHTVASTIKKKLDDLRFLGKNDTKTFKRILQAIILMDLIEWCDDHSEYDDQTVLSRLEEIRNSIFLRNCGFDIKHTGAKVYASVNIPSSNDEWKLVTDAPFVKILNTNIKPLSSDINLPNVVANKRYFQKEISFENYKTTASGLIVPDIDVSNFSDEDMMNIYVKTDGEEREIWYLDESKNWLSAYTSQQGIGKELVETLIKDKIENLRIKNFDKPKDANYLESGILTDGTDNTGKLDLATNDEINELL